MSAIIDLRAFADATDRQKLYIKTTDTGEKVSDCSVAAASALVAVFGTKKKCFWDGTRFATCETCPDANEEEVADDAIRTWEVSIDLKSNQIDFYLGLGAQGVRRSSGLPERIAWRHVSVPMERGALIVALLQSKYAQFHHNVISNSDVGDLDKD